MLLFRAMSPAEWADIRAAGEFRPGAPSFQGKWFAESLNDAIEWGKRLHRGATHGFVVVEVDVPQADADQFFTVALLDGIGPARFADLHQLDVLKGRPARLAAVWP